MCSIKHICHNLSFNSISYTKNCKLFKQRFVFLKNIRIFAVTDSATLPIRTANQGGTSFLYRYMDYTKRPLEYYLSKFFA